MASGKTTCEHSWRGVCAKCHLKDAFALDDDDFEREIFAKPAPDAATARKPATSPNVSQGTQSKKAAESASIGDKRPTALAVATPPASAAASSCGSCASASPHANGILETSVIDIDEHVGSASAVPGDNANALLMQHAITPSSLLRLFKSELLTPFMAMQYLYKTKEPGVLAFLGNRLFDFAPDEIDFYLPQMISMYLNVRDMAEVLHPYIVRRFIKLK